MMINVDKNTRILVIAPHPDDEVIGVGGSLIKWAHLGAVIRCVTVSGHLPPIYEMSDYEETIKEARVCHEIVGIAESFFLKIPATFVSSHLEYKLNQEIYSHVESFRPNIVLIPFHDRHSDHVAVFKSSQVACRPVRAGKFIQILACYETLSETHWNAANIEPTFIPNMVVDISGTIDQKIDAIKSYRSQIHPFPSARSVEAVHALSVFRGTQAGFGFGEGFQMLRIIA